MRKSSQSALPSTEEEILIRTDIRAKILFFWGASFREIAAILDEADGIEVLMAMEAAGAVSQRFEDGANAVVLHEEIEYNLSFLITEILEDYWASYLCLLNGFTKQSQQILRNTLELTVQMLFLVHLSHSGKPKDSWTDSQRGISKIPDKLKAMKTWIDTLSNGSTQRVESLYDTLCASTHSHKQRMVALRHPRLAGGRNAPAFEPDEVLYSKAVFLVTMDLELTLILAALPGTLSVRIQQMFGTMLDRVRRKRSVIDNFLKGYLVRREYVVLSDGTQVLYSVKLNGEFQFPSRTQKLVQSQIKEFRKLVDRRLLQD